MPNLVQFDDAVTPLVVHRDHSYDQASSQGHSSPPVMGEQEHPLLDAPNMQQPEGGQANQRSQSPRFRHGREYHPQLYGKVLSTECA
jgi:hypothetical protein